MSKDNGKKLAFGALLGAFIGFFAGILTAPKSGKETRKDIKDVAANAVRQTEKQLKNIHTEISQLVSEIQDKIETVGEKGKKEVEQLVKNAKTAQSRVKEVLSAIHEGGTDDPELQKVLKEAKAAKEHLAKYLKK